MPESSPPHAPQLVGIGNAIVDVLARTDDAFLDRHGLNKGAMTLIDADQADRLYDTMGPAVEMSGGSAANTIAGFAALGGHAAYIGKVKTDQLGAVFTHDIRSLGVVFDTPKATSGPPTARCLILVTPDAQRTMNTYLGACVELGPADIDEARIAAAQIVYMEGYLWDPPAAKDAFRKAMAIAGANGTRSALTLSDGFCVDRYRDEFRALVDGPLDILFANEDEIKSLYQVDDFDDALQAIRGRVDVAALTRSEKGSVIVAGDEIHIVDAEPVADLQDTTGAGDLFAAGFLYGLTHGRSYHDCARLGGIAAAEVISQIGPRPQTDLKAAVADRMGVPQEA